MIISVDPRLPVPPYEQVRAAIAEHVANGALPAGARLPTVRQLSGDLGLAVNTVARAYRELENSRIVISRGRHGTFVARDEAASEEDPAGGAALSFARTARQLGLTAPEAAQLVERVWAQAAAPGR